MSLVGLLDALGPWLNGLKRERGTEMNDEYGKGYDKGYAHGFDTGYEEGCKDTKLNSNGTGNTVTERILSLVERLYDYCDNSPTLLSIMRKSIKEVFGVIK